MSVWDVASGQVALRIPSLGRNIDSVRWNHDGTRLAVAENVMIRIYDATIGYEQNAAAPAASSRSD